MEQFTRGLGQDQCRAVRRGPGHNVSAESRIGAVFCAAVSRIYGLPEDLWQPGWSVTQQNTVYIPSGAECTVELHFCTFGLVVICATHIYILNFGKTPTVISLSFFFSPPFFVYLTTLYRLKNRINSKLSELKQNY